MAEKTLQIPVGFPPTDPAQYSAWWNRIQHVINLAKRFGLNVALTKANPMQPADVLNPNVLVVAGPARKLAIFKATATRLGLL